MSTSFTPTTLDEAVGILAARPELRVVNGGTDVMVGVNAGVVRTSGWLNLRRVKELHGIERIDRGIRIGGGVTFAHIEYELAHDAPALAMAARTVGSRQIRSVGTIGGNLATASPAGDSLPPLLVCDAEVDLVSTRGMRTVRLADFLVGPKRSVLETDEIVAAVVLTDFSGSQHFAKVGTRNAMVISISSLAARLDTDRGVARVAAGSVGPTAIRIDEASEALLQPDGADNFADIVGRSVSPIDDHRATADYRRTSVTVLARRMHELLWKMQGSQ
jgi:CO/xanthine dehydrogenase FAD-binding subunit